MTRIIPVPEDELRGLLDIVATAHCDRTMRCLGADGTLTGQCIWCGGLPYPDGHPEAETYRKVRRRLIAVLKPPPPPPRPIKPGRPVP